MTFPVYFHILGHRIHPHLVMELLAYAVGSQLYFFLRRRAGAMPGRLGPRVPLEKNLWIVVGCVFGALFGSKLLAWLESLPEYWAHRDVLAGWVGGKTIVGGLLGGWVGVEIAKKVLGITRSTGDLFVFPLVLGMSLGRVGCFLTGLADHTHGAHTGLPWGVDFGDGPRHPTQLYEIGLLLVLGLGLVAYLRRSPAEGRLFRLFILGYLGFRFAVEFIKPSAKPYAGLSAIQLASLAGVVACAWSLARGRHARTAEWSDGRVESHITDPPERGGEYAMATAESSPAFDDVAYDGAAAWEDARRVESWAGELRVNLIRVMGIALFFGRHLVEVFLSPADAPVRGSFHARVTWVCLMWAGAAVVLHLWLTRRRLRPWVKYAATAGDAAMITLLCAIAEGPKSSLVLLFFPLVATAPLRLSLRLVYAATACAIAGYLFLLAHYAWYVVGYQKYYATPELRIPRSHEAIVVLSLLVTGLLGGQFIRQARRIAARYPVTVVNETPAAGTPSGEPAPAAQAGERGEG